MLDTQLIYFIIMKAETHYFRLLNVFQSGNDIYSKYITRDNSFKLSLEYLRLKCSLVFVIFCIFGLHYIKYIFKI